MSRLSWLVVAGGVLILPVLGAYLSFGDVSFLLKHPPEFGRVFQAPFNMKLSLIALFTFCVLFLLWDLFKRRDRIYRHDIVLERRHFPTWGYLGYVGLGTTWLVAWNRYDFLSMIQPYTFTPLWLSFIVVINAHVHRLSNSAPIYKAPGKFALLFLVSAAFWWIFEFLNRFTENWDYTGVEGVSGLHYFVHGSICFSTVLPAVYSMFRLLYCRNALHEYFFLGVRTPFLRSRFIAVASLITGLLGMIGVGAIPTYAYPFVWLGPVLIYGGSYQVFQRQAKRKALMRGDWRWVAFWALAGLICGFFWELWNFNSLLKWEYQVSFFNGLHVFEMPLLGYLGYLPFGVFCGLATQLVFPNLAAVQFSPND